RGGAVEAALQLEHAAMGAPAESRPPAHHSAEISDPRIRLPKRQRLREASAAGWNTHDVIRTCRNYISPFSLSFRPSRDSGEGRNDESEFTRVGIRPSTFHYRRPAQAKPSLLRG